MPRVQKRKARKDYPDDGISKGDTYYHTQIKTSHRSSKVLRSLRPFKNSQLTTSSFKSGWYSTTEIWEDSARDAAAMRDAASELRQLGEEAEASHEAMPEGLKEGHTGTMLEERYTACETAADALEELADQYDEAEPGEWIEGDEFDPSDYTEKMSEMDPEDVAEFLSEKYENFKERYEEWTNSHDEWADTRSQLQEQADEALGDMPE